MFGEEKERVLDSLELAGLRSRLEQARRALTPVSIKLSEQTNRDIVTAVHCCRREIPEEKLVRDLAVTLATDASWHYFKKDAKKYVDVYGTEMDDLYQEFFLMVDKELPFYRPDYDINTFLMTRVKPVFYKTKTKGRGIKMTKHYQDAHVKIEHAISELQKIGNEKPSPEDIHEYLAATEKKPVSLTTIERCLAQNVTCLSLSVIGESVLSGERTKGPEETLLEKENRSLVHQVIARMSLPYREIMEAQFEFDDEFSRLPTIEELTKYFNKKWGRNYTVRRVSNLWAAAQQQFSLYWKGGKKKLESPVNRFHFRDVTCGNEDDDILEAIAEDPDLID